MSNHERHFLHTFFYPESVAVVGAARQPGTLNFSLLSNLVRLKFSGRLYPVNPGAEEILGLKAYPDLTSIEGDVDLAVIAVPAVKVPDIARDCVAKKVKCVALIPGGFSEIGESGKGVQDEVFHLLRAHGIRAIGPNALSPINSRNRLVISFHSVEKLREGGLSFIFQSGLYDPRLNWLLSDFNLYISKLIDLGNKMDITEVDALEYLAQDPETKVIAMHLESIAGDAGKFMKLLKDTARKKPVIVLKSGRTPEGARAASSHTGAIIKSSDAVVDAVLKQAGVIRVQALDEFFDLAKVFEYQTPMKNNRIAVASGSGGEGVIATDLCWLNGLAMARLSSKTQQKLRSIFPPWDIPMNPLDIGVCGQFNWGVDVDSIYLETLAGDPGVDCLTMAVQKPDFLSIDPDKLVRPFCQAVENGKRVAVWAPDPGMVKELVDRLELNRIPVFTSAERAIRALAALYHYQTRQGMLKK